MATICGYHPSYQSIKSQTTNTVWQKYVSRLKHIFLAFQICVSWHFNKYLFLEERVIGTYANFLCYNQNNNCQNLHKMLKWQLDTYTLLGINILLFMVTNTVRYMITWKKSDWDFHDISVILASLFSFDGTGTGAVCTVIHGFLNGKMPNLAFIQNKFPFRLLKLFFFLN